jgi:hypothetical protein
MQESDLPRIPVCDVGENFPMELADCIGEQAYELLEMATSHVSPRSLRFVDWLSRRWLVHNGSGYLHEIDALAQRSRMPGIYFLNVSYEWGCTTAARPSMSGSTAIFQRTLDWDVQGIGRFVVAARIANSLGDWISLTWPAFTGVIQGVAPGRFAAAINQPTRARRVGIKAIDRLLVHHQSWRSRSIQPIHLLRRVFETSPDFDSARRALQSTPISTSAIFTLAGINGDQTVTIERCPHDATALEDAYAANEWRVAPIGCAHYSALENDARLAAIRATSPEWDPELSWARWPLLNRETRLAMMAEPASGRVVVRGYEAGAPATQLLTLPDGPCL